ncbi:MAG: ligand-binding sensor domain-containing protein, partial [Bacteroidia bacterium]
MLFASTLTVKAQQYFFKNYNAENGLPFVQVSCIYQDRLGYLWAGGFGGLTRFDGKTFVNYNPKNGLVDHNVTAIGQDDYGNIFAGTNKGLSVIVKNKIYNFGKPSGLDNLNITCFRKGSGHNMLIG